MRRAFWVWLHRWAGLAMALFLVIVGLTGSVLAFREELDVWLNPELLTVATRDTPLLDPLTLREKAEALYPGTRIDFAPLHIEPHRSVRFVLIPGMDPGMDHVMEKLVDFYLDPYTGEKLGARVAWSGPSLDRKDVLSFLYRLHFSLALPWSMMTFGGYVLGVTALVWTIDCFIGFYLTFPLLRGHGGIRSRGAKSWWSRWKPAWLIKLDSSTCRMNFDIHRALGLWTWAMLFVLAWSSVAFNLNEAYTPVMKLVFDMHSALEDLPAREKPVETPALGWRDALARGRALLDEIGPRQGFRVVREQGLSLDRERGVYLMTILGSRDMSKSGATTLAFDADTGEPKALVGPGADRPGQVVTRWLIWLHMAQVFGLPMQVFVCIMGLVITTLSATGVYIWWKKRRARTFSRTHSAELQEAHHIQTAE